MTNGIYYDFSQTGSMYQNINGTNAVTAAWQPVGFVRDTKGIGTAYNAKSQTDHSLRQWCGWGYLYPAYEGTNLRVMLPDLGPDCSIITITPSGVSIQEGQTIGAGVYELPPYPMRIHSIVDRRLTDQEQIDIFAAYGIRYAINYDREIAARPQSGTIYHTGADLGWTPNADVGASGEVQAMIDLLVDGDEVIFDDMYKISGALYDMTALSDITFRAAIKQTCGLNCLDAFEQLATPNGLSRNKHAIFAVGDGFLVDGFYCTQDPVDTMLPDFSGGGGKRGWFASYNNAKFYGINCKFDTKGWMCFELGNILGTISNAIIARNRFIDPQSCIFVTGSVDDLLVAHNYFTGGYFAPRLDGSCCNKFFDGIKTAPIGANRGPRNPVYVENFADDVIRDTIDTTGGFKNAVIDANVLRNVSNRLDLKSAYNSDQDVNDGIKENSGISMQHNLVDGIYGNAIAITTIWKASYRPDPNYAAGSISSFRNIWRTKSVGNHVVINKNAKGLVSDQDLFIGPWQGYFEKPYDEYTPSLFVASQRTNAIYAK